MACRISRGDGKMGSLANGEIGESLQFQGPLREPPKFWQRLCVTCNGAMALGKPDLGKRGYGFLCGRR